VTPVTGMGMVASNYRGFIVDLWGVIHDGVTPYPGAAECLRALAEQGARTVLLSNAPRRTAVVQAQLRSMGLGDELYTGIMTSGEAAYLVLRDRALSWAPLLGSKVFHLGPERDRNVYAGLPLEDVPVPEGASFVLNTGPDDHTSPTDPRAFDLILERCAREGLPMLCANPDLEVIRDGERVLCAGTLAQRYAALGATVYSLGKPDPAIYDSVLGMLDLPRSQVLAVGDSLRTDMAGAQAAGVDGCWVLGGLHREELDRANISAMMHAEQAGHAPRYILDHFMW
jgi:HAD superfamily hydrolase (TIGR01459 family)